MKFCEEAGCSYRAHAKNKCSKHYNKYRRVLDPERDKKYEKTPKGFLMRMYRNMLSRITGVQKKKHHLYKDKEIFNKEEFYSWAENHPAYKSLYSNYIANNYDQRLAPSCDRVNPDIGYRIDNLEWVTHGENSRRSSVTRKRLK